MKRRVLLQFFGKKFDLSGIGSPEGPSHRRMNHPIAERAGIGKVMVIVRINIAEFRNWSSDISMKHAAQAVLVVCLLYIATLGQQLRKPTSGKLPNNILKAMAEDESDYCDQWLDEYREGCSERFRRNLLWRTLVITPSGKTAILVENHNMGACGTAGCTLYLFALQSRNKFSQILEPDGDVGNLQKSIKVLKTVTNGYYDLQKTWADGKTTERYKWKGTRYFAVKSRSHH